MALSQLLWNKFSMYIKTTIISELSPIALPPEPDSLEHELAEVPHKGFYIVLLSKTDDEIIREGILKDGLTNLLTTANGLVTKVVQRCREQKITYTTVHNSKISLSLIEDCQFLKDVNSWDEEKNGIAFMWGDRYRAEMLPYETRRSALPKARLLDKLCSHRAGLMANAWRLEAGLLWLLTVDEYEF